MLRRIAAAATALVAIAVPLLVVALVALGALAGPRAAAAVAPGVSHDGLPLPHEARRPMADDVDPPLAAAAPAATGASGRPLSLRRACAWGQPGRNPYQGSTEQALTAAGLPPETVQEIAALRRAGRVAGRLEIRTGSIRVLDDGRRFDPGAVALSFGRTMCLQSRVNFAAGHAEAADLYEAFDHQGRRHSVMVPDVCGNVSVLVALGERGLQARLAAVLAQRSADLAGVAFALADPAAAGPAAASRRFVVATLNDLSDGFALRSAEVAALAGRSGPSGVRTRSAARVAPTDRHEVPEPATLACVLVALAVLVFLGRRGKRRPARSGRA
ncbi:MAG: hypothetical protein JNL87_02685 [Burkholderiaceae bacterium]|nr:hypothetical protein [Burkholderiaceae bacterium]